MTAKSFDLFIEDVRLSFRELKTVEDAKSLFSLLDGFLDYGLKRRRFTRDQYLIARDLIEDAFKEKCIEIKPLPFVEV